MIAVIAGATGLVGREVIERLLSDSSFESVISVGRSHLGIESSKLKELLVKDLSEIKSVRDTLKGEIFFCCLGTTIKKAGSQEAFRKIDHDAIVAFAEAAKHHDAKAFVLVSATGANTKSNFFYNRVKGETERDVSTLNLNSLSIFRPALLMGSRQEFRLGEKVAMGVGSVLNAILPQNASRSMMTNADHLAQHMVAVGKIAKPGLTVFEPREI